MNFSEGKKEEFKFSAFIAIGTKQKLNEFIYKTNKYNLIEIMNIDISTQLHTEYCLVHGDM